MKAYGHTHTTHPSSSTWWQRGLMRLALIGVSLSLFACVEINGKADVDAKGHVKVVTTYDFSKVFNNLKGQNPALTERMEGFDCKIFVSDSKNFKCEDEGVLKYKMSDEMDKPVGVTLDEKTGDLSFDAVKFFAHVTDIKGMVQRNSAQGALIGSDVQPLLPLQSARRQTYLNEGLSIVLKVNFANDIVSVDGQEIKNAGRKMTINFMDIADKPSYVIVTRPKQSQNATWLFVLAVLALLALAVWFLWRKNKGGKGNTPPPAGTKPNAPSSPSAANGNDAHHVSKAEQAGSPVGANTAVAAGAAGVAASAPLVSSVSDSVSEEWGAESVGVLESVAPAATAVAATPATITEERPADATEPADGALSRGQRLAQVISAAAVGVGTSAVGAGAHHSVAEVLVQEETENVGQAIADEHAANTDDKKPEQPA